MNINPQILAHPTADVLHKFSTLESMQSFYLSGGTALALLLGHRESEDLDFFTQELFNQELLQSHLINIGSLDDVQIAEGTLNAYLDTVKLQFLYYPYNLLEEPTIWQGIKISSFIDIACTKVITISSRGSKKDFVDMYFILQELSLEHLFLKLDEKYKDVSYNHVHLLKSLTYFDDADKQPMPRMHQDVSWEQVKELIISKVKQFEL